MGPSVITQNKIGSHHMLANSLEDVVAEEAAKRLLPDLNLECKAKKAERIGNGGQIESFEKEPFPYTSSVSQDI